MRHVDVREPAHCFFLRPDSCLLRLRWVLHRSSSSSSSRSANASDTTAAASFTFVATCSASVAIVATCSASADCTTAMYATTYEATHSAISCQATIYGASSSSTSPGQVISDLNECAL